MPYDLNTGNKTFDFGRLRFSSYTLFSLPGIIVVRSELPEYLQSAEQVRPKYCSQADFTDWEEIRHSSGPSGRHILITSERQVVILAFRLRPGRGKLRWGRHLQRA